MAAAPDLRQYPIFTGLSPAVLETLRGRLVCRPIPTGRLIVPRGSCGDFLAIVTEGAVELTDANGSWRTARPGEIFGEEMLLDGSPSLVEARAVDPAVVWLLPRTAWPIGVRRPEAPTGEVTPVPSSHAIDTAAAAAPQPPHTPDLSAWRPGGLARDLTPELIEAAASKTGPAPGPAARLPAVSASRAPAPRSGSRRGLVLFGLACLALAVWILGPSLVTVGGRVLAIRALESGRPSEAEDILELASYLQPHSASLQDAYGYVLYFEGDLTAARAHLEQAAALDPGLASARHNLGALLLGQGQVEAALPHFEAVVKLDPGNAPAQRNLGDALLMAGRRQEAASAYGRAWSLDPALLEARVRWAALILEQDRVEDARQAWLAVLRQQPGHADAQLGLGAVSLLEGRPAAALIHLQAARAANPSDALTCLYLGLSLQALDRPEQAAAEFEQVLALSREPALVDLARSRLLELYPQLVPVGAGQEGGAQTDRSR